jgi:chromosome partitioning protein
MSEERGIIILFGSQKGGAGKTTGATNQAVYLASLGHDVLLLDADPQKNSAGWAARRLEKQESGSDIPTVNCIEKKDNIKAAALDAATRYDAVIIDASGRDSRALRTGLAACDIAYIPCQASAFDLETMDHMEEILNETLDLNPNRIVRSIITMAPTNPSMRDIKEAKSFLSTFNESMPLSKHMTHARVAYKKAALEGLGVIELKDSKAKAEIQLIGQEIMALIEEGVV